MDTIRKTEFPALKDTVYLDHAGTTLVARRQLDAHHQDMMSHLYGNPHSNSPSSQLTSDTIDQVRYRILQHFNTSADDYSVVFTSGCTASLKLLAEVFDFHGNCCVGNDSCCDGNPNPHVSLNMSPVKRKCQEKYPYKNKDDLTCKCSVSCCCCFSNHIQKSSSITEEPLDCQEKIVHHAHMRTCSRKGSFTYLVDNHTSVQGMREIACKKAGLVTCIDCTEQNNEENFEETVIYQLRKTCNRGNHLFAFPAQSNFSGQKYPLKWIDMVKQKLMKWQRSDIRSCQCEGHDKMSNSCEGQGSCKYEGQDQGSYKCAGDWYTVLDAASLVSTSPLDLGMYRPDFVTLSFYKMFGFPTGLGALLVKNESGCVLKKEYYGGGTVSVSLSTQPYHVPRSSISDRLEDGTVSFLDIISLRHGFDVLQSLAGGISAISQHTFHLSQFFHHGLSSCYHGNGSQLATIYCVGQYDDIHTQGAIVNFNLQRANGENIGYSEVDKLAQLYNIHIRTGCFCNMGACQKYLQMADEKIKQNFDAGHVCGDDRDLIDGQPTGSVRVSFGYMSTLEDAQKCLQFIVDCFLENTTKPSFWSDSKQKESVLVDHSHDLNRESVLQECTTISEITDSMSLSDSKSSRMFKEPFKMIDVGKNMDLTPQESTGVENQSVVEDVVIPENQSTNYVPCYDRHLSEIFLYPVKSCGAFKVSSWPLSPRGLLYDRAWMIVTDSGIAMSQKRESRLCHLRPSIDLHLQTMKLEYPGMEPVYVPLTYEETLTTESNLCNSKVCGDRVKSIDCGMAVSDWLSQALQRPGCRLIRHLADDTRSSKLKTSAEADEKVGSGRLSLANESQYLLISRDSVHVLHDKLAERGHDREPIDICDEDNLVDRFRGNLVVSGCEPFEEDGWKTVQIGAVRFTSQGQCTRCQMICLDQQTGERSKEPLSTLAVWRGRKVPFGIHLCVDDHTVTSGSTVVVNVGDLVFAS